jgi:Family of unknown function (DUF5677)
MPTEPFQPLLDREGAKAANVELIALAAPVLRELVNYGSWVFQRSQLGASATENEDLAVFILYRQLLDTTDSIEALVREVCGEATLPLVRVAFETQLSLSHIFQADYVRRSLSWSHGYWRYRLGRAELCDPSTTKGAELLAVWTQEKQREMRTSPSVQAEQVELRTLLASAQLAPIEAEFRRVKAVTKRTPKWYSLFGGPPNLRELARRLSQESDYLSFYPEWSSASHAGSMSSGLTVMSSGKAGFCGLRNPRPMREAASLAASCLLRATKEMLDRFRPGENTSEWYIREVRQPYYRLANAPIVENSAEA